MKNYKISSKGITKKTLWGKMMTMITRLPTEFDIYMVRRKKREALFRLIKNILALIGAIIVLNRAVGYLVKW